MPFLSVDQAGLKNLQLASQTEYWSKNHKNHVSEDFELMIHLYNMGYDGRYVAYPDCESQEGVTRTFDEEAGRHRKFSIGSHELVFNPFQEMLSHGPFTPLFRTFLHSDIPGYYKIYLTAYLFSYMSGGAYIFVFTMSTIVLIIDDIDEIGGTIYTFSPIAIIVLNIVIYYVVGYTAFLVSMANIYVINKQLFFPEYQNKGVLNMLWMKIRFAMIFQLLFYTVMGNYFFLGSIDHLLSRTRVVTATNKDMINAGRGRAFMDSIKFNTGSWFIAFVMATLATLTVLDLQDWNVSSMPDFSFVIWFTGPTLVMSILACVVPIVSNPYILGWPFFLQNKKESSHGHGGGEGDPLALPVGDGGDVVIKHISVMSLADSEVHAICKRQINEIERIKERPDEYLCSIRLGKLHSELSDCKLGFV